jgi:hypothetical protein
VVVASPVPLLWQERRPSLIPLADDQQAPAGFALFHFVNAEQSMFANAAAISDKSDFVMPAKANIGQVIEIATA